MVPTNDINYSAVNCIVCGICLKINNLIYITMSFVGTELKICVSIDPIDGHTMYKNVDGNLVIDIHYELEFYTSNKRKKVTCSYLDCIPNDENSCIALVDTSTIGAGELICVIRAYVPDSNFKDGSRTEVDVIKTNIIINKV